MLTFADIEAAAQRLAGHAITTPVLHVEQDDKQIFIKCENLQRTGSFKFRGAFNTLAQLTAAQRQQGVVACSSGNHAQGVALAAQILKMQATIVMPRDAPQAKIDQTRGYGAEVILYDRERESREEIAAAEASQRSAELVWPYDDYRVMAGQGTCALELMSQLTALDSGIDAVLVPCSGGGLTAGVATALAQLAPACQIFTVEPANFDDHARSLVDGQRVVNDRRSGSICDALLAPTPGELTYAINRERLTGGLVVTDDQVRTAMRYAFSQLKLVLEPGGAAALAAVLHDTRFKGQAVAVIASGGNVDAQLFATTINPPATS